MARGVCWKHQCLTLHLSVLHLQEHQGVSGRAMGDPKGKHLPTAGPQLPQQYHGIDIQACLDKFIVTAYLTLHVAAEPVCWNPSHTSIQVLQGPSLVWEESRPCILLPRHWARSQCQGGVVCRACRASFAEPSFLRGQLPLPAGQRFPRSLQIHTLLCSLQRPHSFWV